ncbi:lipopolysaccharide biosynthesis protein [Heyndrickxia ginsengihumi]|uniref:Oligosaccharide flippase family protein n=2 Tax=Heyndrickxia ginsengihumi TaxID=363870 RepID=A0A6M0P4M7_9BACI|nr:oligosaccharide flippase family protein [Heyndrickxia ginsengihumi]MBE6185650.1 polysaccharide biosynthesis protein [Bacillus sp. (in: firmicutes)]MCM3024757.1 oligosaccharide flippase family protein [Heyndrickxia ginsengihumi]NEY19423.1 oligosaccharide flippase family protein [Heyndrickxia ginsengihumi]
MNGFIKKLLGFSIGPIGGAFIAFITIPLTTHFVSPNEYGKASMFTLFQTLFGTFLYLGIDQAYTREYHETEDRMQLFKNALLLPLLLALTMFLFICFNLRFVSHILFDQNSFIIASFLFGVMIIFMIIERFILLSIRMKEKALEYSIFNILIKLIILICTLIFVIFIRRDFLAVVYSAAIGQIVGDAYLIIRYHKLLNIKGFRVDKRLIRALLTFGLPLAVAASVASLLNSVGRLALRTWSTYDEIGIFTATLKIAAILSVLQTSFTNFWVPTAYRWYSEQKDIRYFKLVSEAVLLFMSVVFFIILIFKQLIVFLLSPKYGDAIYILGFLCLQPVMYTVSETTTLGIVFSKKSFLNIWVSVLSITPSIILSIVLVPKYGAVGAAIATGISYIMFFWGRSFFSNKNWQGFSLQIHFWTIAIMFAGALMNSFDIKYIAVLNVCMLAVVLFIQMTTIQKIKHMYIRKKSKRELSS